MSRGKKTHNRWRLVLGWVTTNENHPLLCIDYVDFMVRYKWNCITFTLNYITPFIGINACIVWCHILPRVAEL